MARKTRKPLDPAMAEMRARFEQEKRREWEARASDWERVHAQTKAKPRRDQRGESLEDIHRRMKAEEEHQQAEFERRQQWCRQQEAEREVARAEQEAAWASEREAERAVANARVEEAQRRLEEVREEAIRARSEAERAADKAREVRRAAEEYFRRAREEDIRRAVDEALKNDPIYQRILEALRQRRAAGFTTGGEWVHPCLGVLGLTPPVTIDQVKDRYRVLAKQHHPDAGGDAARFREVQKAYEQAKQFVTLGYVV